MPTPAIAKALLLLFVLSGCANQSSVYLYQGLSPAAGTHAEDGVFQDFTSDADTVARLWADPDATLHEGTSPAWARAAVNRAQDAAFLTVEFNRSGYGVSVELAPKEKTPERIPPDAVLSLELRSEQSACVGVRFMEGDGEIWAYGQPPLDYKRLCLNGSDQWQKFELPLNSDSWFAFIYGGNTNLGNKTLDLDLVAMMSLELGLDGANYFAPGVASIDVREIRIESPELLATRDKGPAESVATGSD